MKRAVLIGALGLLALGLVASGAGGEKNPAPCQQKQCVAHLIATDRVQHWTTPEVFSSRQGISSVAVNLAKGKRKFGVLWDWCNATVWRGGVIARIKSCGDPAAIRVTFRAVGPRPVPFRVIYRSVR